jgi:DNA repair photolyase
VKQQVLFNSETLPSRVLKQKNGVQHFELSCKTVLNHCDTYRMPDTFTVNPYRGCEFGCGYCYARYTHEFMELDWEEFEKKIFVKRKAADVLLRTLDQRRIAGRHIAIGTATDPYQPAEARFRLTRQLLEIFAQMRGLSLSITTKSSLVRRDIPLFQKIAENNHFQVNISLISLDRELLAGLEPKASQPEARLRTLRALTSQGVRAGIFLMPVLPGLTDSPGNLKSVIHAARIHGAHYVSANVLFLRDSAKKSFYRFLQRSEPGSYSKYRQIYGNRSCTSKHYQKQISTLIENLKEEYGFRGRTGFSAGGKQPRPASLD